MNIIKKNKLIYLGISIFTATLYGCGNIPNGSSSINGTSSSSTNTSSVATQNQLDNGTFLYDNNCAQCHGDLSNSQVSRTSASQIQRAIDLNSGGMGFLSDLTTVEIQEIALALNPSQNTNSQSNSQGTSYETENEFETETDSENEFEDFDD